MVGARLTTAILTAFPFTSHKQQLSKDGASAIALPCLLSLANAEHLCLQYSLL